MSRYPLSRRILAPLEQLILPLPHDEPLVETSTETFACATVTGCANAKRPQIPIRLAQTFITYPSSNGLWEDSTFVHSMIGAESPAGGQLSCKPSRTTGWDHLLDAANGPCQCRIAKRSHLLYRRVDGAGGYGGRVCAVVSIALERATMRAKVARRSAIASRGMHFEPNRRNTGRGNTRFGDGIVARLHFRRG
jgi:hypothetical protein